jgi:hypothetical protein
MAEMAKNSSPKQFRLRLESRTSWVIIYGQKKVFPPLGGEFSNRGKNAAREASSGLKIPT